MTVPGRPYVKHIRAACPDASIVTGSGVGRAELWPITKAAWMAHAPDATHHVVFQDDILPCLDLLKTIETIIKLLPNAIICFYTTKRRECFDALSRKTNWLKLAGMSSCQACAMPVGALHAFMEWESAYVKATYLWDRERFALWQNVTGAIDTWACVPTLVEHLAPDKSLLGLSNKERVSPLFIGEKVSGLSIDWLATLDRPYVSGYGNIWGTNGKLMLVPEKYAIAEAEYMARRRKPHENNRTP